jgi:hypothetical protein
VFFSSLGWVAVGIERDGVQRRGWEWEGEGLLLLLLLLLLWVAAGGVVHVVIVVSILVVVIVVVAVDDIVIWEMQFDSSNGRR